MALLSERQNTPDEVTLDDFKSYISAAADALSPFDYEIRTTQDQETKERVWAFVNSVSDPVTQMATTRTPEEMYYVKRLLDAMFETYNTPRKEIMAITSMQALEQKIRKGAGRRNTGGDEGSQTTDKGVTSAEAERTLGNLVKEKWFERSRAGFYRLSPRALMELRGWLVETYNEDTEDPDEWQRIKFCVACKELVTVGQRCANRECNVRLHNICEDAFWRGKAGQKCPKCDTPWDAEKYVGEMVVTTSDEYSKSRRRGGPSQGNRRSRPVAEQEEVAEEPEEDAEEEAEEDAEEEQEAPEVSRKKRSRHSHPRRGTTGDEDEPEEEEEEEEAEEEESPANVGRKQGRRSQVQRDEPSEDESDE